MIQAASWARSNSSAEIPHSVLPETLHEPSLGRQEKWNYRLVKWTLTKTRNVELTQMQSVFNPAIRQSLFS